MTLIEILFILAWLSSGLLGGIIGFRAGFIGSIVGVVIGLGWPFALARAAAYLSGNRPELPPCATGRCKEMRTGEYRYMPGSPDGAEYECECGYRYKMTTLWTSRIFMIMQNGRWAPFMKHRTMRPWRPDK